MDERALKIVDFARAVGIDCTVINALELIDLTESQGRDAKSITLHEIREFVEQNRTSD